jgi:hypothetical protein
LASRTESLGYLSSKKLEHLKPQNASQIYAYAFVTDKSVLVVVSHGVQDSAEVANDTRWHTHGVTLDSKNCVTKLNENGTAEVNGMIKVANITQYHGNKSRQINDCDIGHR